MKKITTVLIVVGVLLFLYPSIESTYSRYKEGQLLREYEEKMLQVSIPTYTEADSPYIQFDGNLPGGQNPWEQEDEDIIKDHTGALGIIELPKIDIKIPLLYGATDRNLKYGAAQLEGTSPLGEVGNTAIAGHRNYTDERLFSNLDRLGPGDEIIIKTITDTFSYEVFNVFVVEPTDLSVLDKSDEEKILTLITCEPKQIATHRLILQAKLDTKE